MKSPKIRIALLALLIIMLFVNWYHFINVYDFLQAISKSIIDAILPNGLFGHEQLQSTNLSKGISYLVMMFLNVCLSLTIIFVYFQKWKIVRQAIVIIGIYFVVGMIAMFTLHTLGMRNYYKSARYALDILASPLVECAMIPMLKLLNTSYEDLNKAES